MTACPYYQLMYFLGHRHSVCLCCSRLSDQSQLVDLLSYLFLFPTSILQLVWDGYIIDVLLLIGKSRFPLSLSL